MRCLSLTQPFATLIQVGAKKIETRSWATSYRGDVAIHAAKTIPFDARLLCGREPFRSVLAAAGIAGWDELPTGVVLCTCTLVRCVPTNIFEPRGAQERAFGNYSPNRFAWVLADVVPLPRPVTARGSLGLWSWEPPTGVRA